MRGRLAQLIGALAVFALAAGLPATVGGAEGLPLVGANYSLFGLVGCDSSGEGIVANGMLHRTLIRRQLAAMRASGVKTLRLLIWNQHDATGQTWGVVSSAGGHLGPTEERNLIEFATDVRLAGFKRLTVAFSPQYTNDPIGYPVNYYDPSLFDENWQLIREVHGIVTRYGPPATRFDLLNEGAPSDALATKTQLEAYIARMYSNYVDTFGSRDVTVSSTVGATDQSRIANLIDTLRSTGRPLPSWFEVHTYSTDILDDLRATDATLTAKGLSQPITLGETFYNDPSASAAVKAFATASVTPARRGTRVATRSRQPRPEFLVAPPYKADAFITALTGSPPSHTLAVAVGPRRTLSLKTPSGEPVTALEAGQYTFSVTDHLQGSMTFTSPVLASTSRRGCASGAARHGCFG